MSDDIVVRAEGLGKKYLIGHKTQAREQSLASSLKRSGQNFKRLIGSMSRGEQLIFGDEVEEFWALKDLEFEIRRGDVVGVVGKNGSGKSTLLKLLSRITEPSAGRIEIKGSVASLLEVGTGFHPELSGRENIFLNGAILGMTRAEIRNKFDEIVEFSGVENFLDTPVKRYSSGMYVRLAFSVAAHLEPEVLIVDEVLAVGDVEFQKKCLGKMQDVAGDGRTVLFVSHNMGSIARLCEKAMFLEEGTLISSGDTQTVLSEYLSHTSSVADKVEFAPDASKAIQFTAIEMSNPQGNSIRHDHPIQVGFGMSKTGDDTDCRLSIGICNSYGEIIFASGPGDVGLGIPDHPGEFQMKLTIPPLTLLTGAYSMLATIWHPQKGELHRVEEIDFQVSLGSSTDVKIDGRSGFVYINCHWESSADEKPHLSSLSESS